MDNKIEKLEELNSLNKSGLVTDEEYKILLSEILDFNNPRNTNDQYTSNEKTNQNNNNKAKNNDAIVYVVTFLMLISFGLWISKGSILNNFYNQKLNSNDSINSSNNSDVSNSTKCKICGGNFTGQGYDKINGVYSYRNNKIQTGLCSPNCAQKEDERIIELLKRNGYEPSNNSSNEKRSGYDLVLGYGKSSNYNY